MNKNLLFAALLALPSTAWAANDLTTVESGCHTDLADFAEPGPADIDAFNEIQHAKMLNHPALSMMVSGMGAPMDKGARLSLELAQIPALACADRVVMFGGRLKTEDTNKMPVLPRPRLTLALPKLMGFNGQLGIAYVPPVKLGTTSAHSLGFNLGLHRKVLPELRLGLRFQAVTARVADDIAENTNKDGPIYLDFYSPGIIGLGLSAGYDLGKFAKGAHAFAEADYVNVGTFFTVGDDGVIVNNQYPFLGLVYALGVQWAKGSIDSALAWHHAPGSTYGGLRARLGYRWD